MNKYPKFKSNAVALAANTVTEVFVPSAGMEFSTIQLRITNDQPGVDSSTPNQEPFVRRVRIWITSESNVANVANLTAGVFEAKAEIAPNGAYSGFGITVGGGERVFVRADGLGVTVRASGLEHETANV